MAMAAHPRSRWKTSSGREKNFSLVLTGMRSGVMRPCCISSARMGSMTPVVEISQHGEGRVLEMVLPDPVGKRKAKGSGVTLTGEAEHQPPPPFAWAFTHWMNCSLGTTMRLPTRNVGKFGSCISSYPLDADTPSTCATIFALRNSGRSS